MPVLHFLSAILAKFIYSRVLTVVRDMQITARAKSDINGHVHVLLIKAKKKDDDKDRTIRRSITIYSMLEN